MKKYLPISVFIGLLFAATLTHALTAQLVPNETVNAIPYTVSAGTGTGGGNLMLASTSLSFDGSTLTVSSTVSSTNVIVSASGTCSNCAPKIFIAVDQKVATAGGSSIAGNQVRTLNTVRANTITGASLGSNQVTLPIGTYRITASAPAFIVDKHQIFWWSVTAVTTTVSGTSEYNDAATNAVQTRSLLDGRFTISTTTVFELRHYTQGVRATNGLGVTTGNGSTTDVYAQVHIEKE